MNLRPNQANFTLEIDEIERNIKNTENRLGGL